MGRPDWDAQTAWNDGHACGECAEFDACPCGCGVGWCMRAGDWADEGAPCCGDGTPRFEKR